MRGLVVVRGIGGSEEVMNELGTSGRPGDLRHGVEGWRGERWRSVGVEEWRSGGGEKGRRGGVEEAWLKHCLALSDTTTFYKHSTKSSLLECGMWNVKCGAPAAP